MLQETPAQEPLYLRHDLLDADRKTRWCVQRASRPKHTTAPQAVADERLGLILVASVDDQQIQEVGELKQRIRQVIKRITPTSEPRASIESGKYTMQLVAPSNRYTTASASH